MSSANTGSRLALALLAYVLALTLIATLLPFRFRRPEELHVLLLPDALDLVANVLLFVPLGFLYRLATPTRRRGAAHRVLVLGMLVSLGIETAQLFLTARDAALPDVLANALGAWLGAVAFDRVTRRDGLQSRFASWFRLEPPILGLVYLVLPLLAVSALAAGGDAVRRIAILLLGFFGAVLIAGIHRHLFRRSRPAAPHETAAIAAGWFIAGAFPLLVSSPAHVIAGAASVFILCWHCSRSAPPERAERRFEVALLRTAAPIFAAYLAVLIVAPAYESWGIWRMSLGFPPPARIEILRLLELLAACTVLGYIIAELQSRARAGSQHLGLRLVGWSVSAAVLTEAFRGYGPHGASAGRAVLLGLAVVYGGWLYYLHRTHAMRATLPRL